MTSKKFVEDFLNQKKIAVVGVSRKKTKFGNAIYKELKQKGYKVFPINPHINVYEEDTCYPDLLSLPEKVVREAKEAGINKIWLQQGSQSEETEQYCKENGIGCVSNECILMYTQPSAFIHRAHKWVWGVLGKLPA